MAQGKHFQDEGLAPPHVSHMNDGIIQSENKCGLVPLTLEGEKNSDVGRVVTDFLLMIER